MDCPADRQKCVFPRRGNIPRQLAADLHGQMMFPADLKQGTLNDRIQFLDAKDLIQPIQKAKGQFLRKGEGRGNLQEAHMVLAVQGIQCVHIADAMGGNALSGGILSIAAILPPNSVAGILRKHRS